MNIKLLDYKELKDFSPGPGIESFDEHLYVVGDDAKNILVMNRSWKTQEIINLFASEAEGEPATNEQIQIDATTAITIDDIPFIMMIGSGCSEGANKGVLMNLNTRSNETFDLTVFYNRLKQSGFEDLDIESVTVLDDRIILCNKANRAHPDNFIIITTIDFWKNQHLADILTVKIELEEKEGKFFELKNLVYSYENDWFIAAVLSSDTNKTDEQSSPGEFYLGVVEDASRKIGRKRFKINKYFNLANENKKLKGQQVQALCLQADKKQRLKLHLVTKSDKGENFLFKVRLKD